MLKHSEDIRSPGLLFLRMGPVLTLAGVLLLSVCIFALRLADSNHPDAVLFLLVVPIGLVGARFGWAWGLAAAATSLVLFAFWNVEYDVGVGAIGYGTRAVVFALAGATMGYLVVRAGPAGSRPAGRLLIARPLFSSEEDSPLSPRELEVLELIALGATNSEIAQRFVISEDTVKSHVKHILQKLEVNNRTGAALHYVRLYGYPSDNNGHVSIDSNGSAAQSQPASSQLNAASEHKANVIGMAADDRLVLRLDDGATIEVPVLEGIQGWFDVGSPALVYLDRNGGPAGWYLPDAGVGVDMRVGLEPDLEELSPGRAEPALRASEKC